jgi:hypothetical protein
MKLGRRKRKMRALARKESLAAAAREFSARFRMVLASMLSCRVTSEEAKP